MAKKSSNFKSFEWLPGKTPQDLQRRIADYGQWLVNEAYRAAKEIALEAQNAMREGRPWSDITGNARRGLRCEVVFENKEIVVFFIHSVEYGVYLELGKGGRYAIIVPTIHETIPKFKKRLRKIGRQ